MTPRTLVAQLECNAANQRSMIATCRREEAKGFAGAGKAAGEWVMILASTLKRLEKARARLEAHEAKIDARRAARGVA